MFTFVERRKRQKAEDGENRRSVRLLYFIKSSLNLLMVVNVKRVWVFLCISCILFQAWRERYGVQGANGRTRAGYTEFNENQSSPVTEIKKSGRNQRELIKSWNNNSLLTATETFQTGSGWMP